MGVCPLDSNAALGQRGFFDDLAVPHPVPFFFSFFSLIFLTGNGWQQQHGGEDVLDLLRQGIGTCQLKVR